MGAKRKLNKKQKHELCSMLATFHTYGQIRDHFDKEYGIYLYDANIQYYKKASKWAETIEQYREDYNKALLDIPIANARKRLEYLQDVYERAMQWNLEGEVRLREPNPSYNPELPMNKKNPQYIYRIVPKLVSRPGAAVAAVREAHEQVAGRKSSLEVSGPNGKPVPMKMTYFPPEPESLQEWMQNYQKYLESPETFTGNPEAGEPVSGQPAEELPALTETT